MYLFMEEGRKFRGKRLLLRKVREEQDSDLIDEICRRCYPQELKPEETRFLVFFEVVKELPLIGSNET